MQTYILRFCLNFVNIVIREVKWAGLRHENPGLKMSPNPALHYIHGFHHTNEEIGFLLAPKVRCCAASRHVYLYFLFIANIPVLNGLLAACTRSHCFAASVEPRKGDVSRREDFL